MGLYLTSLSEGEYDRWMKDVHFSFLSQEEWRRQLLVDYDTRTNMSICMLCFTTFKSYDGPRKNTYVKHAKRFHPSLEEYSEQERDLIINMYEKYHKYDVDMQKEVNKSYRLV